MKAIEKIKVLLGIVKNKFNKINSNGVEIFYDGDELVVDTVVYDAEGNEIPDGEYTDGDTIYTISDSKVTKVTEKETVEEVENADETVEDEKKEETTETTETEETKEEEKVENEEVTETKEEVVVDENGEPVTIETLKNRVDELERVLSEMYELVIQIKTDQTESVTKTEEIMREFSAMQHSPSMESVTKDNKSEKVFGDCKDSKANRLKNLKNNK